ncbi:hypothetical protein CONPUDRAFT_163419 [Coniophora puteana RWD-64-598 SS2]|uniref:Uncharacterized protein n=1 Tax=Coniophora puteana (strain RWD-64-598) TaxID=741705 RepID=A0A5M3MYM6_CONPW|nr:uncharacterized protein CONPUDRAFT_163419 [Coniophora puteana RWD-64-598 SS2]EIW84242.1 hypothetical protein CONPUDRAFT_163419 [Coniophora puteana RWD-64-598 SS2]
MNFVYPLPFPAVDPSTSPEDLPSHQLFNGSEDQILPSSFSRHPRVSERSIQPLRHTPTFVAVLSPGCTSGGAYLHTAHCSVDIPSSMKATMSPPSSCDYMDISDEMTTQSPPLTVLAPSGLLPSKAYEHLDPNGMEGSSSTLPRHWLLPQPGVRHDNESDWHMWPIAFSRNDGLSPYAVADLVGDLHEPLNLQGASDTPFEELGDATLTVRINWPGYTPFDREIRTDGGTISRDELLLCVARIIDHFAQKVFAENTPQVQPGYEGCRLRTQDYRAGIFHERCIITGLTLYTDGTWRPDIFVPFE